ARRFFARGAFARRRLVCRRHSWRRRRGHWRLDRRGGSRSRGRVHPVEHVGNCDGTDDTEHDHDENDAEPRRREDRSRRNIFVQLILLLGGWVVSLWAHRLLGLGVGVVMRVILAWWLGFPYVLERRGGKR